MIQRGTSIMVIRSLILLFLIGCATHVPPIVYGPTPVTPPEKVDTVHQVTVIQDTVALLTPYAFGAKGDGIHDDADAIQAWCNYAIVHPQPLILPIGNFITSHPILLQNPVAGRFFTLHLSGILSNKSASNEYLSRITYTGRAGYALGIQLGRSIEIENISIIGQYSFPNKVTNQNIGTLKFSDWVDGSVTDSRYTPYAGISIDPNQNANGSSGGTSDVTIRNCAIKGWMVGIALTPNGVTLNDEIISITDDNIESCRVAIAIGQDQSKTISIKGLKVWASVHTILDGVTYGRGTGGGSTFCENWNVAGNCNELFNINTDRFPLSGKDIYSESLFRIGNVGSGAGANFVNCQIDFLTGAGMPAADYLISGQANFSGGCLRYYDNSQTHRLNLSNFSGVFRDMTLNNNPIITGLYGAPNPQCRFDNCHNYYANGFIAPHDTLIFFHTTPTLAIDRVNWIGSVVVPDLVAQQASVGDYIVAQPGSQGRTAYDVYLNPSLINTIVIGRITGISGDSLTLDDIGLNAQSGIGYDLMYLDKIVH